MGLALAGIAIGGVLAGRRRRAATPTAPAALDPADAARLDQDLARHDRL
jgi:hypothetical protein